MNTARKIAALCLFAGLCIPAVTAQSLNGMALNGATGLYTVPTGRIGWNTTNLGINGGYQTIIHGREMNHLIRANFSLFKWVELSAAFDIQPEYDKNDDLLLGLKIGIPLIKNTALALGGNFQSHNVGNGYDYSAVQFYAAATYTGTFFSMPAETTLMMGKTHIFENDFDSAIDFGMGFDVILFPNMFEYPYFHGIIDFSNVSYSAGPWYANAWGRGMLNAGLRINLAAIPALSRFTFGIDVLGADLFDTDRSFSIGAVFGAPVL
ncbi:hypothetical protein FACS1894142_1440 [Spirochaetia bacterium]|nr:hypothetical protein FACS1894142_1440 [Spirochaetia bacterium]